MRVGVTLKVLLLSVAISLVAGCKLAIIIVEGGKVEFPVLGRADCVPTAPGTVGNVCIVEVTDHNFTETFTAVPDPEWRFVRWNSGKDFLCEDSTNPVCVFSNVGTVGNPVFEALVASDKAFYLMPIFESAEITAADIVVAPDGTEWAQPDLFTGLSWSEVNAVCPGGPCTGGSLLNGQDMTGWTWGSKVNVAALFNLYIGAPLLDPIQGFYGEPGSTWAPAFFDTHGWRTTDVVGGVRLTDGWLMDTYVGDTRWVGSLSDHPIPTEQDRVYVSLLLPVAGAETNGAWFYRLP